MRTWTLAVSIVVHLGIVAGVVVAPLFATGELPTPPRATEYVLVTATMPDLPSTPRPPTPSTVPSPDAAPLQAPDSVVAEVPTAPAPPPGPIGFDVTGGDNPLGGALALGFVSGGDPLPPPPPPAPPAPVRVGGAIRAPQKIKDVAPRYPAIAQARGTEGMVILEAVIGEDGVVRDVRVLRSKPLLDDAAIEAVRQWQFTPTLLNGQAVPVVMTVTVSFTLK